MDALLKVGTQAVVGENVDFALKQCFEVLAEFDKIEQAASAVHFNKEVDIAFRASLSSRHGPEHAHVTGAMLRGQLKNAVPSGFEQGGGCHELFLTRFYRIPICPHSDKRSKEKGLSGLSGLFRSSDQRNGIDQMNEKDQRDQMNHSACVRRDAEFDAGYLLEGVHNPKKVLRAGVAMRG